MKLIYLGQVGFLLEQEGQSLVIDPYLSDYVDRHCCSEHTRWVRSYAPPITPEALSNVDFVLCTHSHFDHMDPDTLFAIAKCNHKAVFVCPAPVTAQLAEYGIPKERIIGAVDREELPLGVFTAEPIPAAHEELHTDEQGNYLELGYRITCGGVSFYHAGDCCVYQGLTERLTGTDVMLLPVNGRSWYKRYEQDIIGNMTCEEAILLAKKAGAKLFVPTHYDLYDINGMKLEHITDLLAQLSPAQKFHLFTPGECINLEDIL